jgi:hypothetical protein
MKDFQSHGDLLNFGGRVEMGMGEGYIPFQVLLSAIKKI